MHVNVPNESVPTVASASSSWLAGVEPDVVMYTVWIYQHNTL